MTKKGGTRSVSLMQICTSLSSRMRDDVIRVISLGNLTKWEHWEPMPRSKPKNVSLDMNGTSVASPELFSEFHPRHAPSGGISHRHCCALPQHSWSSDRLRPSARSPCASTGMYWRIFRKTAPAGRPASMMLFGLRHLKRNRHRNHTEQQSSNHYDAWQTSPLCRTLSPMRTFITTCLLLAFVSLTTPVSGGPDRRSGSIFCSNSSRT